MRQKGVGGELSVLAVSGSHVVTFGFDWPEARAGELQGFALHRTNHSTGKVGWLAAQKRYQSIDPGNAPGKQVSTLCHPVQSFLWADYTVEPGVEYTYRVHAMGGMPQALKALSEASVTIKTIDRTVSGHAVHFNRGAVAAQEYARRFHNRPPGQVPDQAAFEWLGRGLPDALIRFLDGAGSGDGLHVAIYEARHNLPLDALVRAQNRGVDVRIIYDAKQNGSKDKRDFPKEDNEKLLNSHGLKGVSIPRTQHPSYIAHNKFVVYLRQGTPQAVWTGSTNWSENGFYGQMNVGHEVWNPAVAERYEKYWGLLSQDPDADELKSHLEHDFSVPAAWPSGCTAVFSPYKSRVALDQYIAAVNSAEAVFVTLAFSMDGMLADSLKVDSGGLRYVLMDGIKGNKPQVAALTEAVHAIRQTEAARVAIGAYLHENALDQFLVERSNDMASHVQYIHTKFMLVDPLGDRPLVITGSANFSKASCTGNDENMLVIQDDPEVADIYIGEFMRAYAHYAFRDAVESSRKAGRPFLPAWLNEDCSWAKKYFEPGFRCRQRQYFSTGRVRP